MRISVVSHPHQHLILFFFLIFAILIGVLQYVIVIFMCISLKNNDFKHHHFLCEVPIRIFHSVLTGLFVHYQQRSDVVITLMLLMVLWKLRGGQTGSRRPDKRSRNNPCRGDEGLEWRWGAEKECYRFKISNGWGLLAWESGEMNTFSQKLLYCQWQQLECEAFLLRAALISPPPRSFNRSFPVDHKTQQTCCSCQRGLASLGALSVNMKISEASEQGGPAVYFTWARHQPITWLRCNKEVGRWSTRRELSNSSHVPSGPEAKHRPSRV